MSKKKEYLSHYDQPKLKVTGFHLDQKGEYDIQKQSKINQIKAKLSKKLPGSISLDTKPVIASEYMSQNEMKIKFRRPKTRKKKKKSRKKILELLES